MNTYYETDDDNVMILEITGNKHDGEIFIDTEDYCKVSKHTWYIKDGSPNKYVAAKINKKTIKLHRFLMDAKSRKEIIDHEDRDTFNNRKYNLRNTNSSTNNLNCSFSKNNISGRTGVYLIKAKGTRSSAWRAQWQVGEKKKTKMFSIEKFGEEAYDLAVQAREEAEEKYGILTAKTN